MYGADWTPELVEECLIAACLFMPGRGLYSPRSHQLLGRAQTDPVREVTIIADAVDVMIRGGDERRGRESLEMLLAWARASGQASQKATEASIAEVCRTRGWKRDTFDRRRKATARELAVAFAARRSGLTLRKLEQEKQPST